MDYVDLWEPSLAKDEKVGLDNLITKLLIEWMSKRKNSSGNRGLWLINQRRDRLTVSVMVNSGLLNNKWNANCDTSSIKLECQKIRQISILCSKRVWWILLIN